MRDAKNKPFEADVVVSDASTDMRQDWVILPQVTNQTLHLI